MAKWYHSPTPAGPQQYGVDGPVEAPKDVLNICSTYCCSVHCYFQVFQVLQSKKDAYKNLEAFCIFIFLHMFCISILPMSWTMLSHFLFAYFFNQYIADELKNVSHFECLSNENSPYTYSVKFEWISSVNFSFSFQIASNYFSNYFSWCPDVHE